MEGKESMNGESQAPSDEPLQQPKPAKTKTQHPKQAKPCPHVERNKSKNCKSQAPPKDPPQQPSKPTRTKTLCPKQTKRSSSSVEGKDPKNGELQQELRKPAEKECVLHKPILTLM